jgi:hypothetical protein
MAASVTNSIWAESKDRMAYVNMTWVADSGGLCNSLGIIGSISGTVMHARIQRHNVASGYSPHSGYGVKLFTGGDFDVLRNYGATLVSSNNLTTLHYSQSSLDFALINDSLRISVNSAGDNRTGIVQLALRR